MIYKNQLGGTFSINDDLSVLAVELKNISFLINREEVTKYVDSTGKILEYYKECQCPKDLANKRVSYKTNGVEITMTLSMNELLLLQDLMKGTQFNLNMDSVLDSYRIR